MGEGTNHNFRLETNNYVLLKKLMNKKDCWDDNENHMMAKKLKIMFDTKMVSCK